MHPIDTKPRDPYRLRAFEIRGGNGPADERLTLPGFEAFVYALPLGEAGGDLRFVSTCAMGQIVRFTLADISGHGPDAGDWALRLRALIRKHINHPNPAKFARALNWEFSRLADAGGFATALIATYFAPTDHLIVCNAGHPRPLLYRAAAGRWELLDETVSEVLPSDRARETGISNLPLGVITPTSYPLFAVRLEPGDVYIAYTDAIIESTDARGRQLGESGLLELAQHLTPEPHEDPGAIGQSLLASVQARAAAPSSDDLTLLVLRHTATDPPSGPVARLKALGRLVGLVE